MQARLWAALRTVVVGTVFIATFAVWLPWRTGMLREDWRSDISGQEWFGLLPLVAGTAIVLWCAFAFAFVGRGTPAPFDPPRRLVVVGLYRYVRNPMYLGLALILAGEWILVGALSFAAVWYPVLLFIAIFLFVVTYEEPALRNKFNGDYVEFCQNVPRWFPRMKQGKRRHFLRRLKQKLR